MRASHLYSRIIRICALTGLVWLLSIAGVQALETRVGKSVAKG